VGEDDFTLYWLEVSAQRLGNEAVRRRIQQQRRTFGVKAQPASREGELPARYETPPDSVLQ
jgi:hypothetical protein